MQGGVDCWQMVRRDGGGEEGVLDGRGRGVGWEWKEVRA